MMDWEFMREKKLNSVLLCGFPKVGNTWARFLVMNYFNILNNNAKETLTYEELTKIQRHRVERDVTGYKKDGYTPFKFDEGFPPFYHTHVSKNWKYSFYFKEFDKLCYLLRNPCDTMISYYYYLINRDIPFNGRVSKEKVDYLRDIQNFAKYYITNYTQHIKETLPYADLILKYEDLREDPFLFKELIELFGIKVNNDIVEKAIKMSSFDSIKKMGRERNQKYGLAKSYRGEFTRDGRVGQYKQELTEETIQYIEEKFTHAMSEM